MKALNGCSELSWIDLDKLGRAMGLRQSNASRLTDSNERMPLVFSACVALFSAVNTPDQHFWPTPRAMPFIDIPGYAITSRPSPPLRFACQHHPQQLESSYNFPLAITPKVFLMSHLTSAAALVATNPASNQDGTASTELVQALR